jgi:DNA-binding transcriptional regulator YiaG
MQERHNLSAATKKRNVRTFRGGEYVANLMAKLSHVGIAQRVKKAREEAGLKQTELADLLQVHWRTIQNWESRAIQDPSFQPERDSAKAFRRNFSFLPNSR